MTGRKSAGDRTFIKITNKDIYNKLVHNEKLSEEILVQAKITNGKVKMNRRLIYTLGSVVLAGFLFILSKLI